MIVRQTSMALGSSTFSQVGHLIRRSGRHLWADRVEFQRHIQTLVHGGVTHLELWWEPRDAYDELIDTSTVAFLLGLRQAYDCTYSVHLPFIGLDIAAPEVAVAEHSAWVLRDVIRRTSVLNCTHYVLHLGQTVGELDGYLGERSPAMRQAFWVRAHQNAARTLRMLLDEVPARRLAVENLASFPLEEIAPIIERCNLSVCLDVGNAVRRGEDLVHRYEEYRGRIVAVHLHDVAERDRTMRRHQPVAWGGGAWKELLQAMDESDFQGVLVLEVETEDGEDLSFQRIREQRLYRTIVEAVGLEHAL